ncbi:uncharacterized protein BDW43DRAFT_289831, partial [Aspergillus alliaceus]|uniref:uncharacterized protein n=1 Tax=Petromyces alliaceus TaxID=209559 RepID=UPI0012A44B3F
MYMLSVVESQCMDIAGQDPQRGIVDPILRDIKLAQIAGMRTVPLLLLIKSASFFSVCLPTVYLAFPNRNIVSGCGKIPGL